MARMNVEKRIKEGMRICNTHYSMSYADICYILEHSTDIVDTLCNGFYIGYAQGVRAAKAELKRRKQ